MEEEIICVNGVFSPEQLEFWLKYKVIHPLQDGLYTIRELIYRNSEGNSGFLLNEINNPKIPIKHPILGVTMIEPYWDIKRFRRLDGTSFSKEDVKEMDKQKVLFKDLNF